MELFIVRKVSRDFFLIGRAIKKKGFLPTAKVSMAIKLDGGRESLNGMVNGH